MMLAAQKPNAKQKQLIRSAGLDPEKWLIRKENGRYLYLVNRGIEQRENLIIDKIADDVARKMP